MNGRSFVAEFDRHYFQFAHVLTNLTDSKDKIINDKFVSVQVNGAQRRGDTKAMYMNQGLLASIDIIILTHSDCLKRQEPIDPETMSS